MLSIFAMLFFQVHITNFSYNYYHLHLLIFNIFKLTYTLFTIVYQFQIYSKVIYIYVCVCVYVCRFFSLAIYNIVGKSFRGFPCSSAVKNPSANARDAGFIPRSGRFPGEKNGNSLQYSCLENAMNRGVWWAIVHGGHKESDT